MSTATRADATRSVAPEPKPPTRKPRRQLNATSLTMVALVTPSILLLLLINAYPFIYAAFQSVHNGSLINSGPYVGTKNYSTVLSSSAFWQAARFTLLFTVVGVFGSWAVGLGMAVLLRTNIPVPRPVQGPAAVALGRPDRGLGHIDQLPGRHREQPDPEAVP